MKQQPEIEVIDLTRKRDDHRRLVYVTLLRNWWPHPFHGQLAMSFTSEAMVFRCVCGESLMLAHEDASALGLIDAR